MATSAPSPPDPAPTGETTRRGFLARASGAAMIAGLAAGYGTFAQVAVRYLYPAGSAPRRWMFVARADEIEPGAALRYRAPSGAPVNIARQGAAGDVGDFIALSSTCPHLGCQVHWEPQNNRFFCPCHNGVFDPSGIATAGPPADAGQSLPRYPLKLEGGLLFIEVPTETLVARGRGAPTPGARA